MKFQIQFVSRLSENLPRIFKSASKKEYKIAIEYFTEFDKAIGIMRDTGIFHKLSTMGYRYTFSPERKDEVNSSGKQPQKMGLQHLFGTGYLLGFGLSLGTIVFHVEYFTPRNLFLESL